MDFPSKLKEKKKIYNDILLSYFYKKKIKITTPIGNPPVIVGRKGFRLSFVKKIMTFFVK